jgi:hypothetical protein
MLPEPTLPVPTREPVPTRALPAIEVPGLMLTEPEPGALVLPVPAPTLPLPVEPPLPLLVATLPDPELLEPVPTEPEPAEPEPVLPVPAETEPVPRVLAVVTDAVVEAA